MIIETMDFKKMYEQYEEYEKARNQKLKVGFPLPSIKNSVFLYNAIPVLASIPVHRNKDGLLDAQVMLGLLNDEKAKIKTPNGEMPANQVYALLRLLWKINRSEFVGSMTKFPTLASLTPIPMYAMKLHHNIKYDEWDKKAPGIGAFLGPYLQILKDIDELPKLNDSIANIRELMLRYKTGQRAGTMESLLSNKGNAVYDTQGQLIPKVVCQMLAQTWLANVAVRKPGIMILDPINWENVPEAIDETKPQTVKSEVSDPWE